MSEICSCGGRTKQITQRGVKGSECTSCGKRVFNNQQDLFDARDETKIDPKALCKKCGSLSVLVEILPEDHHQPAVVKCAECGRWIKWSSYDQVRALWDKKLA